MSHVMLAVRSRSRDDPLPDGAYNCVSMAHWRKLISKIRWARGSAILGVLHQRRRVIMFLIQKFFSDWQCQLHRCEWIRQRGLILIPKDYVFWCIWMEKHLLWRPLFSPHARKWFVTGEYHATMWHNYLELSQVSKPMCFIAAKIWQSLQWASPM